MESRVGPLKDVTQFDDSDVRDSTCLGHSTAASFCGGSPWQEHRIPASSAGHEGAPELKLRGSMLSRTSSMRERLHEQRPRSEVDLH